MILTPDRMSYILYSWHFQDVVELIFHIVQKYNTEASFPSVQTYDDSASEGKRVVQQLEMFACSLLEKKKNLLFKLWNEI